MASGIAGTSMILASRVLHCAPKMADPSRVIRSTVHTGGSDGAMAGCGEANGRTGVAAMMTGGATGWYCVGMAAPLLWPPAMDAGGGGRCYERRFLRPENDSHFSTSFGLGYGYANVTGRWCNQGRGGHALS